MALDFPPAAGPCNDSTLRRRRTRRQRRRSTPLRLEQLEDRRLLAVDCAALSTFLDGTLQSVHDQMSQIDNTTPNRLPVINKGISEIDSVKNVVGSFRKHLVESIATSGCTGAALQTAVTAALGSGGANVLNGDVELLADTPDHIELRFDMAKTVGSSLPFDFGLGLDGLPIEITSSGDVSVGVTFAYEDFTFGWRSDIGNFFKADSNKDLQVFVHADLSGDVIQGVLGFLEFNATADAGDHDLSIGMNVDLLVDTNGSVSAKNVVLNGDVNTRLHLSAGGDQNLPSIQTDLVLSWEFLNVNPQSNMASFGGSPSVKFESVKVDLGTVLSQTVKPIVDFVKPMIDPLNPVLDALNEPIPVLSDVYEAFSGGDTLSAMDILAVANQLGGIPAGYDQLAKLVEFLVPLADLITQFESSGNSVLIDFGDFDLGKLVNKDLRLLGPLNGGDGKTLKERIANLSISTLQPDLESLATMAKKIDLTNILSELPGPLADAVGQLLKKDQGNSAGYAYSFPLIDSPFQGVISLLTGTDVDLFTFEAFASLTQPTISFPGFELPIGLEAGFEIDLTLDAKFKAGYDTRGIRQVFTNGGDLTWLADGFYLMDNTRLYVLGGITAKAGLNTLFFDADVIGGLQANIKLDMHADPNVDPEANPKKVHILSELPMDCMMHAEGGIGLGLSAYVFLGADLFFAELGIKKTFDIASVPIASFQTSCVDNPYHQQEPVHLAGAGSAQPAFPGSVNRFVVADGKLRLNMGSDFAKYRNANLVNNTDIAEHYVIFQVEPNKKVDPSPLPAGEIIGVSAFGFTEYYYGVTSIEADAGAENDSIVVKKDVAAKLTLHGGSGNDVLTSNGIGLATLRGGDDDDVLLGGFGENWLYGGDGNDQLTGRGWHNYLEGGLGDDFLTVGNGQNTLIGGPGDDRLVVTGTSGAYMEGNDGNDEFQAGGNDFILGGRGDDSVSWQSGTGSPIFIGGHGNDTMQIMATAGKDTIVMDRDPSAYEIRVQVSSPGVPDTWVVTDGVERFAIQAGKAKDHITLNDVTNTSVQHIGVNLGDILDLDHAKDTVIVKGTPGKDTMLIDLLNVVIQKPPPRQEPLKGGVMLVAGLPNYSIYAANVQDQAFVYSFEGDDELAMFGIPGPTDIDLGSGDDKIRVHALEAERYLGHVDLEAGSGKNRLQLFNQTPAGDHIVLTHSRIQSNLFPHKLDFVATDGDFSKGFSLYTDDGPDTVQVRTTLPDVTTEIKTLGGNDQVTVSSSGQLGGHLALIRDDLDVDLGAGFNYLLLGDRAAAAGNSDVHILSNQILGLAGLTDQHTIHYQSSGGAMLMMIDTSNAADVAENIYISNPNAMLLLSTRAGNDSVFVDAIHHATMIFAGAGDDFIHVGDAAASLDSLNAPLTVIGQGGSDELLIADAGAASGHQYVFDKNLLNRTGAGQITFESMELLQVRGSAYSDVFTLTKTPKVDAIVLDGGPGANALGWLHENNTWQILGADQGKLNTNIDFFSFSTLIGGSKRDRFEFTEGASLAGKLDGGAGDNLLDYSAFTTPIEVLLPTKKATAVAGPVDNIRDVIGGEADDLIVGNGLNNFIFGRGGNDILLGGDGNDKLYGESGRDVLIGGIGLDWLFGGDDDDILIAARTVHDDDFAALQAVMAEWRRTDLDYQSRIANLRNGGGLNGAVKLNDMTIAFDDMVSDRIRGEGGTDWFWAQLLGPAAIRDKVFDLQVDELVK